MATITINVDDAVYPRMVVAIRKDHPEFDLLADDVAVKRTVRRYLRQTMVDYETWVAEVAYVAGQAATITAARDKATTDATAAIA